MYHQETTLDPNNPVWEPLTLTFPSLPSKASPQAVSPMFLPSHLPEPSRQAVTPSRLTPGDHPSRHPKLSTRAVLPSRLPEPFSHPSPPAVTPQPSPQPSPQLSFQELVVVLIGLRCFPNIIIKLLRCLLVIRIYQAVPRACFMARRHIPASKSQCLDFHSLMH